MHIVGSVENPHILPMSYKVGNVSRLRPELRNKYTSRSGIADLIADGDRTGTTRTPPAGVLPGHAIKFPGVAGIYEVTAFERIDLQTPEGREAWSKREGWDTAAAETFGNQVRHGAMQMQFKRTDAHTFTLSGLGNHPFTVQSPGHPKALENNFFACEHCGKMLRNRFFVESADGIVSVVGIDCLTKTGDSGLIAGAARIIKAAKSEAIMEKRTQALMALRDAEKIKFNGLTKDQVVDSIQARIASALNDETYLSSIAEHQVSAILRKTEGNFALAVMDMATAGKKLTDGMTRALIDITTKAISGARKGSKMHSDSILAATTLVKSYAGLVSSKSDEINTLENEIAAVLYS